MCGPNFGNDMGNICERVKSFMGLVWVFFGEWVNEIRACGM